MVGALTVAIGWKFTVHQQAAVVSGFSLCNTVSYLKSVAFTFAQDREGFRAWPITPDPPSSER
jgi:hypothetical protein